MNIRKLTGITFKAVAILAFSTAFLLALPAAAQTADTRSDEAPVLAQYRVELNSASEEELISLPGIGPALAHRIIEARKASPFLKSTDLQRVEGIGPRTMQRLLPHIRVNPPSGRS